jgi:retron-type reverse transcriptase
VGSLDLQAFFDRVNHDRLMARLKSKRAGERVMASVTRFVSDSLRLTVNPKARSIGP